MFEDSLVESQIAQISKSKRWTTFASISLQCAAATLMVMLPLLHPQALSFRVDSPRVLIPLPPKPPAPPVRTQHVEVSTPTSTAVSEPIRSQPLPSLLPNHSTTTDAVPPMIPVHFGNGISNGIPNALELADSSHVSVAPARPAGPVRVTSGVSQGMLLEPIRPIYPSIARAAGVQGTVVVEAVISRTGTIERLHVLSGPILLQQAALEAIRAARYKPFQLNGEPTEVQTTITMNFRENE